MLLGKSSGTSNSSFVSFCPLSRTTAIINPVYSCVPEGRDAWLLCAVDRLALIVRGRAPALNGSFKTHNGIESHNAEK